MTTLTISVALLQFSILIIKSKAYTVAQITEGVHLMDNPASIISYIDYGDVDNALLHKMTKPTRHEQMPHEYNLGSTCSAFTVGDCLPSSDKIVDIYNLLNSDKAVETCKKICQIHQGCTIFKYDSQEETCILLYYQSQQGDHLAGCNIIGGPPLPTLESCQHRENMCNRLIRQDCQYLGDVVFNKIVVNAHTCQALLRLLGPIYNGNYFYFDNSNSVCNFYSSSQEDVLCKSITGNIKLCSGDIQAVVDA